jgi:RNA polymerase sigma-70 factor (ECF subfamily)
MDSAIDAPQPTGFDQLLLAELDGLYRTAKYLTQNAALAEDLVQETALKALRSRHTFQPDRPFRPWVFAILRNTLNDHYRREGRRPRLQSLDSGDDDSSRLPEPLTLARPDDQIFHYVLDEEIELALQDLPETMRFAVLMADVEQLSYQEIAQLMEWPKGTVMSRLSRGRRKLREALSTYAQRRGYAQ